jgi:hypothetical protein
MTPIHLEHTQVSFLMPVIWGVSLTNDEQSLIFYSAEQEDNFWDTSVMVLEEYSMDEPLSYDVFFDLMGYGEGVKGRESIINDNIAFIVEYVDEVDDFVNVAAIQRDDRILLFTFWVPEEYTVYGKEMFAKIIESIVLD